MFGLRLKRFTAWCVSFLLAWMSISPEIVAAQGVDLEAPVIEHTLVASAPAGTTQEFMATVTDNNQVAEVILAYRFEGESDYSETVMSLRSLDDYFADVDTDPDSSRSIEYYIRATDLAGTSTLRGFAFQPLVRTIVVEEALAEDSLSKSTGQQAASEEVAAGQTEAVTQPKRSRTWLYVLGGVLVAGAVAAAAGGGGGGGGSDECADDTCTVTFQLQSP